MSLFCFIYFFNIQGVFEIRVLILTIGRTRQFMKLFSITFCKIRKHFPRFFDPQFLPNESFCVINYTKDNVTFYLPRPFHFLSYQSNRLLRRSDLHSKHF
jgi:hypothetical protein